MTYHWANTSFTEEDSMQVTTMDSRGTITTQKLWPAGPCYISGPMRRIKGFNFPAFFAAEDKLTSEGAEVGMNPARYDVDVFGFDWRDKDGHEDLAALGFDLSKALTKDLEYILGEARWVVCLPGWQNSTGATAEVAAARAKGLPVLSLETGLPVDQDAGWLCLQAAKIVGGARRQAYGSAEDNFGRIAILHEAWDMVMQTVPAKHDGRVTVAIRNILQKLARIAETPDHTDSWRDIAGYSDCGARCANCDPTK